MAEFSLECLLDDLLGPIQQQSVEYLPQLPDELLELTSFGDQHTETQLPAEPTLGLEPTECSLKAPVSPSSRMKLCPLPECGKRVKRLWNHVFQVHKKEGRYTGI